MLLHASVGLLEILNHSSLSNTRLEQLLKLLPSLISTEYSELQISWAQVYEITVSKSIIQQNLKECMTEIFTMSAFSKPTYQRKGAAMMLGSLGKALGPLVTEEVIRKAITLAQDISFEVRRTMCANLWKILKFVNKEMIQSEIWDDLIELWSDDAWEVKTEAVGVISRVIEKLDINFLQNKFLKVWEDMRSYTHTEVSKTVLAQFGRVILMIKNILPAEIAQQNLMYYTSYATHKQDDFRYQVAFQLPAVISLYHCFPGCCSLFEQLATDSSFQVKLTFEAGLSEILKTLPDVSFFPKLFNTLFQDSVTRIKTVSHLSNYMKYLQVSDVSILPNLSNLLKTSLLWRDKIIILSSILDTFESLNIKQLKEVLYETLVSCMENDIYPVKLKATELYVKILYETYQFSKKQEMIQKIINSFYMSRKYLNRMIYIEFVIMMRKLASRQFIKTYFLNGALNLAEDSVVDVRLKFVENFLGLRECVEKTDTRFSSLFANTLNNLMDDSNEIIGKVTARVQKEMLSSILWNRMYSIVNEMVEQERAKYELLQQEREKVDQEEYSRKLIQELSTKIKQDVPLPRGQVKIKPGRYLISKPRLNTKRRNSFNDRAHSTERPKSMTKSSTSVKPIRNK